MKIVEKDLELESKEHKKKHKKKRPNMLGLLYYPYYGLGGTFNQHCNDDDCDSEGGQDNDNDADDVGGMDAGDGGE